MLTEPISRTALLTAAARARETEREGAILRDPYARALAGDEGMRMLDAQGDERPIASLAVRGRFLDDALATALARGVRGVVLLAAGLDARAYRMALPPDVTWLEVDRAAVLAYKRGVLGAATPAVPIADVAADVRDAALGAILATHGLDASRPVAWIAEGLFPYLDEAEASRLLATIAASSAPGSTLLFDAPSRASLDPAGPMGRHLAELAASGAPWRFGTDDPGALVRAHGFIPDVVHVGHPRAHFGRLASPPREAPAPGAPVTWLVSAERDRSRARP
jgi:methyltransferase (TIGR00027 family)